MRKMRERPIQIYLRPDQDVAIRAMAKTENVAIEIPTQLRHYEDRHWFLATQVAEVKKFNVQSAQDFIDLAAVIQRGEMVSLPSATENYILFGVGAKVDNEPFSRYEDDHRIALYNEAQLNDEYRRQGRHEPQAQVAHGQRHERLQAIQNELAKLSDLGRRVRSVEQMKEQHRGRLHFVKNAS